MYKNYVKNISMTNFFINNTIINHLYIHEKLKVGLNSRMKKLRTNGTRDKKNSDTFFKIKIQNKNKSENDVQTKSSRFRQNGTTWTRKEEQG